MYQIATLLLIFAHYSSMNFSGKETMNSYGFRQSLTHGKVCSPQFLLPTKFHEDNVGPSQAGAMQSGLCQSLETPSVRNT